MKRKKTAAPAIAPAAIGAAAEASRGRLVGISGWPAGRARVLAALGLIAAVGLAATWFVQRPPDAAPTPAVKAEAVAAAPAQHVDNGQCLSCHQEQAAQWQASHHAKAMAPATAQTVLGRFDGSTFTHQGVSSRFFQRDGRFMVRTDGPDGKPVDFDVAYTFGVAPLQQYLIAQPGGRLQALQIAWDDVKKRWFHLLPNEKTPAGDVLHWTGRYQNANTMCITCHTTGYEKRYDAANDRFDSHWKEVNVSCQACHGPGGRHVEWARSHAQGKAAADLPGEHRGLSLAIKNATPRQQVDNCAACHSRRSELTATFMPGVQRWDQQLPMLLTEGLYHADGQQLDEVFVDGSFRQSRMYMAGVGCADCHDSHSGKPHRAGNALCTHCHAPAGSDPRFPKAAGLFDAPSHHFHPAGSAGAQCVACHMPAKTYMQIQPRPDHSLRVPRPDLSVKIGTPNACNQCHADKPAQWAADQVARWYGPRPDRPPHYGETFAAARTGQPGAAEALARLAADRQQPPIVRATALDSLRNLDTPGSTIRLDATRDPDPEVRVAAADAHQSVAATQRLYALAPLLTDPVLAVRIAAARSLSSLPAAQIDAATRPAFDAALAEAFAAYEHSLDMPGGRLGVAVLHENLGRTDQAEQHYLAALKLDPDFTPARANLSRLYNASARNADAERVLRDGLQRNPGIGELQYSLGLLLAEEGRMAEAATALGNAAASMPQRARVQFNLGLVQQRLGRLPQAMKSLARAYELDPSDPAPAQALAVFHLQAGNSAAALEWAQRWADRAPSDPQARQMVAKLQQTPTR